MRSHHRIAALAISGAALAAGFSPAQAGPTTLVANGSFETTSMSSPTEMTTTNVANWSTTGYNFIYFAGTGQTGSYTPQFNGKVGLWGPDNGSPNGFTPTSPDGGNFVGADGAFEQAPITQTVNGLEKGGDYAVTFYYAGAQQYGFTGATTEAWIVSLGGQSFETPVLQDASHGFTGWFRQTFIFEASAASEVLSFLAVGTPNGEPPFSLLDGVSASEVPEPGTWTILGVGFFGICLIAYARRRRVSA